MTVENHQNEALYFRNLGPDAVKRALYFRHLVASGRITSEGEIFELPAARTFADNIQDDSHFLKLRKDYQEGRLTEFPSWITRIKKGISCLVNKNGQPQEMALVENNEVEPLSTEEIYRKRIKAFYEKLASSTQRMRAIIYGKSGERLELRPIYSAEDETEGLTVIYETPAPHSNRSTTLSYRLDMYENGQFDLSMEKRKGRLWKRIVGKRKVFYIYNDESCLEPLAGKMISRIEEVTQRKLFGLECNDVP